VRNGEISELLCTRAEQSSFTDQQRRALRRAGRAALRWPEEAETLVAAGRPLTELRSIGPWLARIVGAWIEDPPPLGEPPVSRRGFLTRPEVAEILDRTRAAAEIRGDLQTHTLGSDGNASVRAMADAAIARGLSYLAITDHSKGLRIANGMDEAALERQAEEIRSQEAQLADTHPGFRILRGVEMNLSPAGEGDLAPTFLAGFDLVLGAFHSRLRVREDQTHRYLAALDHPAMHVLAHPRGRIFDFRVGLRADWPRVFERALRNDRAIEIDAYPDRQDLDLELLRIARDVGVRISIGSDAHATDQLAALDYGVASARAAGISDDRILNCMTGDALTAWARGALRV
jgi:histidinol phosphatase-like PHP family hydrolase